MRTPITTALEHTDLSLRSFARLAQFITSELGIKMPDSKLTMLQSRLLRRVRELHLDSLDSYCEYFFDDANASERDHFINAVTTNKTDFFREAEHLEYLIDSSIPALLDGDAPNRARQLNVWSAGCSSGEEAYSLAMLLNEYALRTPSFTFEILATDISTRVLRAARDGIYQEAQIAPVPPELRRKYLLRGKGESRHMVRVSPALRSKISFHRLNFMDEEYPVRDIFDVIFFRNVMIYFDKPTQERVVNRLCRHLAPGGYLFVGHSESLAGLDIPLRQVHTSIFTRLP